MKKSRLLLSSLLFLFFLRTQAQTTGDVCSNPAIATLCGSSSFTAALSSYKNDAGSWQVGGKTITAKGQDIYYQLNLPNTGFQTVSISALLAGYYTCFNCTNKIYFLWFEDSPCTPNPVEVDSAFISGNSKLQDSLSFTHNVITSQLQYYLVIDFGDFDNGGYQYSINLGFTDNQVSTPTCTAAPPPYKKAMTLDQSSCYTSASPYQLPLSVLNDNSSFPNILFPRTLNQTLNYLPVNDDNGDGFILSLKSTDVLDTETYHFFNSYPYSHAATATYVNGVYAPSQYNVALTIFVKNNGGAQGLKGFRIQVPSAQLDGTATPQGSGFYNTTGKWNTKFDANGNTCTWLFNGTNGRGDNKTDTGYSCRVYTFDVGVLALGDTIKAWYLPDNYGNDSLQCTTGGRGDCSSGSSVITYESGNADWIALSANGSGSGVLTGQTCGTLISCIPGAHLNYPCAALDGTDGYIYTPHNNCGSFRFNINQPGIPYISYDENGCRTEVDPEWLDEFPSLSFTDYNADLYGVDSVTICKGQAYQLPVAGGFSSDAPAVLVYVDENAFGILRPVEDDGAIDFNEDVNQLFGYPQPSPGGWPTYDPSNHTIPLTRQGTYQIIYGFFDFDTLAPFATDYYGYNFGCQTYYLTVDTPVITFNPASPTTLCNGQDINITTNGVTSYQWLPSGSIISSNGNNVDAEPAVTTTYTITGTDNNGCMDTAMFVINVNNCNPVAGFISPVSTCTTQCVTYIDTSSSNATSWQWIFSGGNPSTYTGQFPPQVCYSDTGTYETVLIAGNLYGSDTMTASIHVTDCSGPVAAFGSPSVACKSHCITYNDASTGNPTSWSWTFTGGSPSTFNGQFPPQVCYSDSGNFETVLIVSNFYGSDTLATVIRINDCSAPVAGFISPDTSCTTQCVSYIDTTSDNATSWQWTFNGGSPSSFSGQFPPQVCYSDTGNFQTVLIASNLYGNDTMATAIRIIDCSVPVAGFISNGTVCTQQCSIYTDTSAGNPTSWRWTFLGGSPSSFNGQSPPQICYFDEGHYIARLIVSNRYGSDTITKTVIAKDCTPPTAGFIAVDTTCRSQCITYADASSGTPVSWQWSFEGGNPATASGQVPPPVCYNTVGTFQAQLITTNSNGSDTLVKFITVQDCSPRANFTSIDTVCNTQCVTYTDSSTGKPTSWRWTFNGGSPSFYNGKFPPQVCYSDTGSFQTILIVNNSYGSDTLARTTSVQNCIPPIASFTIAHDTICYGECIMPVNTSTGQADYHWTFIGGSTTFYHGEQPPTICYTDSGHFLVRLVASNKYGNDTSILRVIVKNCVGLQANFLVNDTICKVNCVPYTNVSSSNGKSWVWSFEGGKPSSYTGKNPPLICYDSAGTYTSQLIVSDGLQIDTAVRIVVVVDCSSAASFAMSDNSICTGNCITLTNTSSAGDTLWHWNFPGGNPSTFIGQNPPQVCYNAAGQYVMQLIAYNNFGYASMSRPVNVTDCLPNASFSAATPTICQNSCVGFVNHSSDNSTSWHWIFESGTPSTFDGLTPPPVCYARPGSYDVTLIVTNISGSDTSFRPDYINVTPLPDPHISQRSDTLETINAATYQWYFSNFLISGATNQTYVAGQNGLYTVNVIDSLGCAGADSIQFIGTGTGSIESGNEFIISPNPNDGLFQVTGWLQVAGYTLQVSDVQVYNVVGEIISDAKLMAQGSKLIVIDLSSQPDGIYFVRVQTTHGAVMKKVVVAR